MTLPDATAIAEAMTFVTEAWNALPLLGTILAIAVVFKVGPRVVRVIRNSI